MTDSPYDWVQERDEKGLMLPERYREEYYRSTKQMARLLLQLGQARQAVPLYKSLLEGEPALEDVVRDVYRCYQ